MSDIYPYNYPLILDDDIFQAYGGVLESTTPAQRNVAFVVAEQFVTDDIGTLLLPTIVTGTQIYDNRHSPYITEYGYVNQVILVRFLDTEEDVYYSISGTANVYASLRNDTYGIVDIHHIFGNCQCATNLQPYPYQFQVVYEAGLPTGTASNPKILLALTTAADMVLNQIEGYGNEADGLVGLDEFKNQDYSEKRHQLRETAFGSSARAQFVSNLLVRLRKHRFVRLR
jgi:hypothetical protein